jgi:hypothetical protein
MYQHLLVPVEDTDASVEAIGHATEFAWAIGARITFLHVSSADAHADEWLARAEAGARAQGVACTTVVASGDDSFDTLIAQARRHGCDLICTSASPAGTIATDGVWPGVLSCGTDRRPAAAASIGALLNAHRRLADTLNEWLDTLRAARERDAVPSAAALREIVRSLQELPARGVGARAKTALFRCLRKRTSAVNAELAELERLHQRDEELLHELARMVSQDAPMLDVLEQAVSAYARFAWDWMGREQGVILPAARRYLSYADWTEIDGEFNSAALVGRAAKQH